MSSEYQPLSIVSVKPRTTFQHPPQPPERVSMQSAAFDVMTDFNFVKPVTVNRYVPIDEALEKMRMAGVRMLVVTNDAGEILGIITANDIMGERPIEMIQERQVPRSEIRVEDVMTHQENLDAFDMVSIRNAQVGHILETLSRLGRQHMLVVEVDKAIDCQRVCGMFSTTQIRKQLNQDGFAEVTPAGSLADVVQSVGH